MKAGEAKNGSLGSGRVISDGGIKHRVPFPSLSNRPGIVTSNQSCIRSTPPRAQLRQGTMGQTSPLACRKNEEPPIHPRNLDGSLAAACLTSAWPLRGGKAAAESQAVHADPPAPCHPKANAANGRPHLAAWLRAESLCWGDCRSITSPVVAKGLSAVKPSPTAFQSAAAPAPGRLRSVELGLAFFDARGRIRIVASLDGKLKAERSIASG